MDEGASQTEKEDRTQRKEEVAFRTPNSFKQSFDCVPSVSAVQGVPRAASQTKHVQRLRGAVYVARTGKESDYSLWHALMRSQSIEAPLWSKFRQKSLFVDKRPFGRPGREEDPW